MRNRDLKKMEFAAMSEIKFPKRLADNSFVVFARFSAPDPAISALVRDYLKAWIDVNGTWARIWRSNVITVERLEFHSEFSSEPRVEEGADGYAFSIVWEGKPAATRWKDWVVFLVDDVSKVFPEVKFEAFDT